MRGMDHRDEITRQYFNSSVTVKASVIVDINGRELKDRDFANLTGAFDGSIIHVDEDEGVITMRVVHEFLQEPMERALYRQGDSLYMMLNNSFMLKHDYQESGLGARSFAIEATTAAELGLTAIYAEAAGRPGSKLKGYSVWPILGYDADLDTETIAKLPEAMAHCRTLLDLYAVPGGYELWDTKLGKSLYVAFDLSTNSRSWQVLHAYMEQRGIRL